MTQLEYAVKLSMTSAEIASKLMTWWVEIPCRRKLPSTDFCSARGVILLSIILLFREGLAIETSTRNRTYSARVGDTVTLECEFYADDDFNLFDYPVLWKKRQVDEEYQVNMMGNLIQPFLSAARFRATFKNQPPRYVFGLTITNILSEDNGNYSCEISGPQNSVIGFVTHHLFISAQVDKVILTNQPNETDLASFHQPYTIKLTENVPQPLGCIALGGYPTPHIELFHGHRRLTGFEWSQTALLSGIKGLRTVYYTTSKWNSQFEATAEMDGSHVKCVVKVAGGFTNTTMIKLSVSFAPRISCEDATGEKGNRRRICVQCEVQAKPSPSPLYWIIDSNGTTVRDGKSVGNIWMLTMERTDGVMQVHLYVEDAAEDRFRTYILVAENSLGRRTRHVTLQPYSHESSNPPKANRASRDHGPGRSKTSHVTWLDQWLILIAIMRIAFQIWRSEFGC